jgi:hypothetical protein
VIWTGENRSTQTKFCPSATFFHCKGRMAFRFKDFLHWCTARFLHSNLDVIWCLGFLTPQNFKKWVFVLVQVVRREDGAELFGPLSNSYFQSQVYFRILISFLHLKIKIKTVFQNAAI